MKETLSAIYRYRGFIKSTVKRDFQSRYQRSMLGVSWLFLQPLAMILVYTLVFSNIMKAKLPGVDGTFSYSLYLCSGILTWGLFTEILSRSTSIFLDNANLLKKVNFPRICLPIIVTVSSLFNYLIVLSLFTIFLIFTGNFPGWHYLEVIPVIFILIIFVTGLGIVFGVLNVFFRDVGQLVNVIIQFWFWLTPIVYPVSILPPWVDKLLSLNPVKPIVQAIQIIFVKQHSPVWSTLIYPSVVGLLLLFLGFYLFRKHAAEIVDEI